MDDLTPEDDLKPDTSDRRPQRARKPSSPAPKLAVSRQYLMIGIGIIVLVLVVLGIGSALKSPSQHGASAPSNGPKDINLSGNGGDANSPASATATPVATPNAQTPVATAPSDANAPAASPDNSAAANGASQPKSIGLPPISTTPTDAQPQADSGQKERVDLPGDMNDALSQQQGQVNAAAQDGISAAGTQSQTSLPTGPATLNGGLKARSTVTIPPHPARRAAEKTAPVEHRTERHVEHVAPAKPPVARTAEPLRKPETRAEARKEPPREAAAPAHAAVESGSVAALKSAPGSHFTLQLSGASQSNSLNAFAHQQGLKNYTVYQTERDGKPWFVLVSGNYASSAEAKRAIASLPADVQAKKPWVKPVHQVQQALKK